jgi:hypothetical protein
MSRCDDVAGQDHSYGPGCGAVTGVTHAWLTYSHLRRHLQTGGAGSRHLQSALAPSQRGAVLRWAGRYSLGGSAMGFAWITKSARRGFGAFDFGHFDADLGERPTRRSGDHPSDPRPGRRPLASQRTGLGRHARPRGGQPVLGGLGVTGSYPRIRIPRNRARRPVGSRGAHAASRAGAPGHPAEPSG